MAALNLSNQRRVSLCEVLDRVLHKGAVISGEIRISVADIDLIRLGLQLVLASSSTLNQEGPLVRLPQDLGKIETDDNQDVLQNTPTE